jgi:hypothetical protein
MKPSSDIDLFTTTLPFPVLVVGTVLLRRTFAGCHAGLRVMTLRAPESHRLRALTMVRLPARYFFSMARPDISARASRRIAA